MNNSIYIAFATFILLTWMSCTPSLSDSEIHETIYVRHAGADMPAYVHGNPDKKTFLIVVHGAGSFGLSFRKGAFTEVLEKEYVVVYFDQRGQSMAQGHYNKPDDLISLMAEDVDALIKVLKHSYGDDINLFLMGHSLGGLITAKSLSIKGIQPSIKGWINVDGLLDINSISKHRKELILAIADEQMSAGNNIPEWKMITEETQSLISENNQDYDAILQQARKVVSLLISEEIIDQGIDNETLFRIIIDNNPIHWLVSNFFNQPVQESIRNKLSVLNEIENVEIPALFIYGKYDVSVPPETGKEGFDLITHENKEFHTFDHSIHRPMDSEPGLFGSVISDFIEKFR